MADPITHRGAGILFVTSQGKALFLKRGPGGDAPGAWCFPGGTMEAGETAEQTALREAAEELGSFPKGKLTLHTRCILALATINAGVSGQPLDSIHDRVDFTTFVQRVTEEFAPQLNGEHTGWAWASLTEPPAPLHPGCQIALDKFSWDELGVARAMAAGQLTSPQLYGNVHLFDMRITGTGVAYRGPKMDGDTEVSPEEFVFRRPENYLTDEFLARCNGLSVIMMHPAKALLNSKEFGARVVGSFMLPYIKGDEVWGIAKIYDDDTVKMMLSKQMSTSPAVLLGNGDQKLKTEDGTDLLIEGKPSLLDHLAICERGVWDKGGDPSGVRTDNQTGDTSMDLTKEQMEAFKKQIGETVAAALPGVTTAVLAAVRADDSGGQKLDKVLSAIDAFCGKMDAFEKKMDSHGQRMDAFEKGEDKDEKKDTEEKEKKDAKKDGDEEMIAADKKRKDTEEKEAKEKADAEMKDKEKADSEHARLVAANVEMATRLIAVERGLPKQLTDEDRHAFSAAQSRADDVYSAFGKKAPFPLSGEDVLSYRRRLAANLKDHSPAWKDVDVLAMADSATFKIAEEMILKDAAVAALHPTDLKDDELRAITRQDQETGVRTTTFVGNHSFVRGLTRPAQHVRHIGARKQEA